MEYGPGVVQPFDPAQGAGIARGIDLAMGGSPQLGQALGYAGGIGSGQTVGMAPGQGVLEGIAANGAMNPATGAYQDLLGTAMGGSGGLDYLRRVTGGEFLGGNPYLEGQIDAASQGITRRFNEAIAPGIETRLSMAGALGGDEERTLAGEAQRNLAGELANLETGIRFGEYGRERGLQQQAGLALPGAFGQEIDTGLAAAGGLSGNVFQDLQARMAAATAAGSGFRADQGLALQGAGMVPGLYGAQFAPYEQLLRFGGLRQGQAERQAAEAQDRFRFNQQAPWDNLNQLISLYQGIGGGSNPGLAGQFAAGQLSGPSGGQVALGNALAIAGTAASLARPNPTLAGSSRGQGGNTLGYPVSIIYG